MEALLVRLREIQNYSYPASLPDENLPVVWAVLFLGSLAVAAGHLLYQAFAPTELQKFDEAEYVSNEVTNYAQHNTIERLNRARFILENYAPGLSKTLIDREKDLNRNALSNFGVSGGESAPKDIDIVAAAARVEYGRMAGDWGSFVVPLFSVEKAVDNEVSRRVEVGLLSFDRHTLPAWKGFLIELLTRNFRVSSLAMLLYLLGTLCIVWIVIKQTETVLSATGWEVSWLRSLAAIDK